MRMRSCLAAFAVAAVFTLALADPAHHEVAVGDQIEITAGAEIHFGDKKPKVKAVPTVSVKNAKGGPKLSLKIVESDDTTATLLVKKAKGEGSFDIQFTPKGADAIVVGTVSTMPPDAREWDASVELNGELVIAGEFFGSKKGKVSIGGRKAKVLSWANGEITVRVHKKTPLGLQDLAVSNTIGESVAVEGVTVVDPDAGVGAK